MTVEVQPGAARNTITANSAIAAATINEPAIGIPTSDSPFRPPHQVEMRVRRRKREVLLDTLHDACEHPGQ